MHFSADLNSIEDSQDPHKSSLIEQKKESGIADDSVKEQSISKDSATDIDMTEKSNSKGGEVLDPSTNDAESTNVINVKENDGTDGTADSGTSNKSNDGQGDKIDDGKGNDADGMKDSQKDDKDGFDVGSGSQSGEQKGSQINGEDGIENVNSYGHQNNIGESSQANGDNVSSKNGGKDDQRDEVKDDVVKDNSKDSTNYDKQSNEENGRGNLIVNGEKENELGGKGEVDDETMNSDENDPLQKTNEDAEEGM